MRHLKRRDRPCAANVILTVAASLGFLDRRLFQRALTFGSIKPMVTTVRAAMKLRQNCLIEFWW